MSVATEEEIERRTKALLVRLRDTLKAEDLNFGDHAYNVGYKNAIRYAIGVAIQELFDGTEP